MEWFGLPAFSFVSKTQLLLLKSMKLSCHYLLIVFYRARNHWESRMWEMKIWEFICIKFLLLGPLSNLVLFKFVQNYSSILYFYEFFLVCQYHKGNFHPIPFSQWSTSKAILKICLWFSTSILRLFILSKYPLPSETNGKLMLLEISPLKGSFGCLKVFYITVKDLGFSSSPPSF